MPSSGSPIGKVRESYRKDKFFSPGKIVYLLQSAAVCLIKSMVLHLQLLLPYYLNMQRSRYMKLITHYGH